VHPESADDLGQIPIPAIAYGVERPWKRPKEQSTKSEGHGGNNLPKIRYPSLKRNPGTFCGVIPVIRDGETSNDRGR